MPPVEGGIVDPEVANRITRGLHELGNAANITPEMAEKIRIARETPDAHEPLHTDEDVKRCFPGER